MWIPTISADDQGHSYFEHQELVQVGDPARRIGAVNQDISSWQMRRIQPGHFIDFHRSPVAQFVAVLTGSVAFVVSNGEERYFSRGDMLLLRDLRGQGHTLRTAGIEPCTMLVLNMPGEGTFNRPT